MFKEVSDFPLTHIKIIILFHLKLDILFDPFQGKPI